MAGEAAALDRRFFHWIGCLVLLFWGAVMIYYFTSGRITHYLTGAGTFRVQCLVAGFGLLVLGLFNLLAKDRAEASAPAEADDASKENAEAHASCGHHDHGHDHDHSTCGHHHHHDHDHEDCGHESCGHDHGGHGHTHGDDNNWFSKITAFFILAVPLGAAAVYSPDAYSPDFIMNKVNAASLSAGGPQGSGGVDFAKRAEDSRPAEPAASSTATAAAPVNANAFTVEELERLTGGRTPEGNIKLRLDELYYMPSQTRDVQEVVAQQRVETVGQAIKDKQDPTKMRVFLMMMSCCAADARPITLTVEFTGTVPEWREMAWYKLTGTVEYRELNGASTTVFKADTLAPEKPPRTQMLY